MLSLKSYAKINIALNVTGKTEDGYHLLDSITLPIELHDTILMSILKGSADTYVTIDDFSQGVIDYNIATFAIEKMSVLYNFDKKFRVYIHKNIPMQAGLGGGSSNAAFVMKGVNKLLKLGVSNDELRGLAKSIGADVPFFIDCVPARMEGIGEILNPIKVKNNYYCLIVKPSEGLATKDIFNKGDEMELTTCDIDKVISALAEGDDELLAESIGNSLEAPAIKLLPEIGKIEEILRERGLKIVGMTGSGSSVFALSSDRKLLKKIESELEDIYQVCLTKVLK